MMPQNKCDPLDELVGRNIRLLRMKGGMSQSELGARLKLTFQQIQKYERGTNRVGSGRLFRIASIFGVPVAAFFEGADAHAPDAVEPNAAAALLTQPDALRLLTAFSTIRQKAVRRSLTELAEALGADGPNTAGAHRLLEMQAAGQR